MGRLSELGNNSDSWRSGGGGVLSRLSSSEGGEIRGKSEEGAFDDIVSGVDDALDDDASWSLRIDTSTLESSRKLCISHALEQNKYSNYLLVRL